MLADGHSSHANGMQKAELPTATLTSTPFFGPAAGSPVLAALPPNGSLYSNCLYMAYIAMACIAMACIVMALPPNGSPLIGPMGLVHAHFYYLFILRQDGIIVVKKGSCPAGMMLGNGHMSAHVSAHVSTHMSTHVSTHISTHMSIHMSIHMPARMPTHMPASMSTCMPMLARILHPCRACLLEG